jgi:hypothetical protein
MTTFFRRRRRAAQGIALCVAFASTVSCYRGTTFFHDAAFVSDGKYMKAASLMPRCGCVTLRNSTGGANGKARDIFVISELYGTTRGTLRLKSGEESRVRFDWAGPGNSDFYKIFAAEVDPNDKIGNRLPHAWDGISKIGQVVETTCQDSLCDFGSLAMDRAVGSLDGITRDDPRTTGVQIVNNGLQMELASREPACGCVILENTGTQDLRLRMTFHGADQGVLLLPVGPRTRDKFAFIGFDWAGALADDVYVLSAVAPDPLKAESATRNSEGSHNDTNWLKIRDHVRVVEQMNFLPCTDKGAVMLVPDWDPSLADGPAPPICPFQPFRSDGAWRHGKEAIK